MRRYGRQRYRQHGNPYHVRGPLEVPDWPRVYSRDAPFAIDVGCGPGIFLLELAKRYPQWNVLGLEIRQPWVANVLEQARFQGITNVWALVANANVHLDELVPDSSVACISLNFPDPWFKRRHHKRRVLNRDWLAVIEAKLRPGGSFHLMTDFEPIAQEAYKLLEDPPHLRNETGGFCKESTTGIQSEREISHMRRGHPVYRLHYRKKNS
jgi:tRNA (guanine-N7-)-methyltransferase